MATSSTSDLWIAPFSGDGTAGPSTKLTHHTLDSTTPTDLNLVSQYVNQVYTDVSFTATHAYVITWYKIRNADPTHGESVSYLVVYIFLVNLQKAGHCTVLRGYIGNII